MNLDELQWWADEAIADPLAQRFIDRAHAGDAELKTPEDVLGHRLTVVARFVAAALETRPREDLGEEEHAAILTAYVHLATGAMPHLWSEALWNEIWSQRPPDHVISPRALPLPYSWHTWPIPRSNDGGGIWFAVLIVDTQKGIRVNEMWDDSGDGGELVVELDIPYGKVWPDDFPEHEDDEHDDSKVGAVLRMMALLSSPYIPRTRERMSRGARREIGRRGSEVDPEDEVTFVLLRRVADRREKTETEVEVEWKHRWLVSGHLRAQWYPSEQAHHLIWIAPYMKGPEDAPLREHVYKVAR